MCAPRSDDGGLEDATRAAHRAIAAESRDRLRQEAAASERAAQEAVEAEARARRFRAAVAAFVARAPSAPDRVEIHGEGLLGGVRRRRGWIVQQPATRRINHEDVHTPRIVVLRDGRVYWGSSITEVDAPTEAQVEALVAALGRYLAERNL